MRSKQGKQRLKPMRNSLTNASIRWFCHTLARIRTKAPSQLINSTQISLTKLRFTSSPKVKAMKASPHYSTRNSLDWVIQHERDAHLFRGSQAKFGAVFVITGSSEGVSG